MSQRKCRSPKRQIVIRNLMMNIADCVVIEDSPTGVAAGQASGAYVVAVPHMVDIEQAPRRTVCRTLSGVSLQDLARWMTEDHR